MAFSSGFFNSKNLDRTYTAENFCDYLGSIICNGIQDNYGDCFKLTAASSGLSVSVGRGKAWINGHYFINDSRYVIDLTSYQDESLPRYVGIAIYLDTTEFVRSVTLKLFPGTPAENPQLPSIPQDENHVRLLLYAVRLNPGATELTERDWYDYREDRNVCGYCRCILGKCRVTEMLARMEQIEADLIEYNETIAALTNAVAVLQTKVDDLTGDVVATGTLGEDIYCVKYSNGRLLLRGTGATYSYDLGESPFWEDEDIRTLVVSEGITAIGNSVFERCVNMKTASFPSTLTAIGERAFFMYTHGGLTELMIPPSVTTLGERAFVDQAIISVTLPATLTTLGTYIFMGCTNLRSARVECSEVPGFCFVQCGLTSLTLSHNVTKVCSHMINYTPLTEITYEGSLNDWASVTKQSNWDGNSGQAPGNMHKVQCLDGYMQYDTETGEWTEVRD